jgi:hypothetical protein
MADTGHVIYHSLIRPANTDDVNLRASMFAGEPDNHNEVVKSRNDFSQPHHMDDESKLAATISPSPVFNPQDLIGRSFLMNKQSDGQKQRATIIQLLEDHESHLKIILLESNLRYHLISTNRKISSRTIRCWNALPKTRNPI